MRSEDLMRSRLLYLERENQELRSQVENVLLQLKSMKRWLSKCGIIFLQELVDEDL